MQRPIIDCAAPKGIDCKMTGLRSPVPGRRLLMTTTARAAHLLKPPTPNRAATRAHRKA